MSKINALRLSLADCFETETLSIIQSKWYVCFSCSRFETFPHKPSALVFCIHFIWVGFKIDIVKKKKKQTDRCRSKNIDLFHSFVRNIMKKRPFANQPNK